MLLPDTRFIDTQSGGGEAHVRRCVIPDLRPRVGYALSETVLGSFGVNLDIKLEHGNIIRRGLRELSVEKRNIPTGAPSWVRTDHSGHVLRSAAFSFSIKLHVPGLT